MQSYSELNSLEEAANQGDASAQLLLGDNYRYGEGEFEANIFLALKWYEEAASQGNKEALKRLGYFSSPENKDKITVVDLCLAVDFYKEITFRGNDEIGREELKRIAKEIKYYTSSIEGGILQQVFKQQQEFKNASTSGKEDLGKILDNINAFVENYKPKPFASEKGCAVDHEAHARMVSI
ncbi:MAG: sel1 repeat family protein [Alphaproteobacteria bacterium]|nr:sel1 repeat family protein [Alphaproteobacteria bacterium]